MVATIVAAIIDASAESGPSTRIRDRPTTAYARRHVTLAYKPVIAGSPASSAYAIPCGTNNVTSTSPATTSWESQERR